MTLRSTQPPPAKGERNKCVYCKVTAQWKYDYRENSFSEKYAPYCHSHAFWFEILDKSSHEDKLSILVRVDGSEIKVYSLSEPLIDWEGRPSSLGFGGHWWRITVFGVDVDEVVVTNNLWSRGTVPHDMKGLFYERVNVVEMRDATMQEIQAVSEGRPI